MHIRKRNLASRLAEILVSLVDFSNKASLGPAGALQDKEAAVVQIVNDIHDHVFVGPAEGGVDVKARLAGQVEEALDGNANVRVRVLGSKPGDSREVFGIVPGEALAGACLEDGEQLFRIVVLEVDGLRLECASGGCVHGLEYSWAVGEQDDHVVGVAAAEQVEDFHGAVFGAHGVDFVQDDHGLARVGVAETGEELVEAGAAWWDMQEIGQGLEAGVVVSDVAVEDGNGVVAVEFLGEVSHHEGFAAAAAAEDGEVFGDSGVGVAEDGVDDGFGFVAHEGLVGDVVEVEDAVVFDGAGVVAQGFFSGA